MISNAVDFPELLLPMRTVRDPTSMLKLQSLIRRTLKIAKLNCCFVVMGGGKQIDVRKFLMERIQYPEEHCQLFMAAMFLNLA